MKKDDALHNIVLLESKLIELKLELIILIYVIVKVNRT